MKNKLLYIFIFFLFGIFNIYGQETLLGRVIDEDLRAIPGVRIYANDSIVLGCTNFDGFFEISKTSGKDSLNFVQLGYEKLTVAIYENCDYIELILLEDAVYHMSVKKVNRLRRKRFDKLPELHREAFEKEIFKMENPCIKYEFVPFDVN